MDQRRLVIERHMDIDTAVKIVGLLAQCPGGPTFTIQRGEHAGESVMFFSKRTYDFLQRKLADMKREGEI